MTTPIPDNPKIYHIVHFDRLTSIINAGVLWSDAEMTSRPNSGTKIGMRKIKQRRLHLVLDSHVGLHVGDCVPFYFCPRSIMLYMFHRANHPEIEYRGGQGPIVHLEADLHQAISWAERNQRRWAFTLSNAGSAYATSRCDLKHLGEIDWKAVGARQWQGCGEEKQAEFLVENQFPFKLFTRIGVSTEALRKQVSKDLQGIAHSPDVEVQRAWYY